MRDFDLLKLQADQAYDELLGSIKGLSETQAWARVICQTGEYLHSEGSILSTVMHIASAKFLYGSCAYRELEVRWRHTVDRLESFWPSWKLATAYLEEAHEYWLASWAQETDAERMVERFNGEMWPSWKIITTVTHHDCYHAGQIQILRSTLPPSAVPPPEEGDLWRKYCAELPSW